MSSDKPGSEIDLRWVASALPVIDRASYESLFGDLETPYHDGLPRLCEIVAGLVVDRRLTEKMVDLCPSLASISEVDIPMDRLLTRTRNVLRAESLRAWGDIEQLTVEGILGFHNSGVKTAWDIVRAAVHMHLDTATQISAPSAGSLLDQVLNEGADLGAATVGEAIEAVRDNAVDLWSSFASIELERVDQATSTTSQEGLAGLLASLSDRDRLILLGRHRRSGRLTLSELGEELELTRERVRQLQKSAERKLRSPLSEGRFAELSTALRSFGDAVGTAAPLNHEIASVALGELIEASQVDSSSQDETDLLLALAGPYRVKSGWLIHESWRPELADDAVRRLVEEEIVTLSDAHEALRSLGLRRDVVDHLIQVHPDMRRIGPSHWVRWTGSVGDKAAIVLSLRLEPMTPLKLVREIGEGHAPGSLRNEMGKDGRFVRVDRRRFGLSQWEFEEYEGIAKEIEKRLTAAESGVVDMNTLVDELSSFATPGSIRTYCGIPKFVLEDGSVRLRTETDPAFLVPRNTERSLGVFWFPGRDRVALVFDVDAEILRGSGRQMSWALAGAADIAAGESKDWHWQNHQFRIAWPITVAQPQISSLRAITGELGLVEGGCLIVVISRTDESMDCFTLQDLDSARFGCSGELKEDVARCLGCSHDGVEEALRSRGDHEDFIDALLS